MQRSISALLAGLKACSLSKSLERGRVIHKAAIQAGADSNIHVSNTLISMYAKCASLHEARNVFLRMEHRDVVSWTALILGHAENGESHLALELFSRMRCEGCAADARAFVAALKACTGLSGGGGNYEAERAQALYLLALISGCGSNIFVQNTLLDVYGKCGRMLDSGRLFDSMKHRDAITWTTLIMGYAESGESAMALESFSRMRREGCTADSKALVAAVKSCTDYALEEATGLSRGRALHMIVCGSGQMDGYVGNTLVAMYAKCGDMKSAHSVFDNMEVPGVVAWTALMSGYVENGEGERALNIFTRMDCTADAGVYISALQACTSTAVRLREEGAFELLNVQWGRGRALHLLAVRKGLHSELNVQNTLIDMYSNMGRMQDAEMVFRLIRHPDSVSWSVLLSGYAENGESQHSLELFSRMESVLCTPNRRCFGAAIKACTNLVLVDNQEKATRGRALHLLAVSSGQIDMYVENSLVDLYAKCGHLEEAFNIFDRMDLMNVVSSTALILGCAEYGKGEIALDLFTRMRREGCCANERTFVAVLKACGDLADEKETATLTCRAIHLLASRAGCDLNSYVQNSLIDSYSKCGSVVDARAVFDKLAYPDVVSWNALMSGYAEHGEADLVLDLLGAMKRRSCEPNCITFMACLKACGLMGALEAGRAVHAEINSRGLEVPAIYLVDFYAKCGSLSEAEQVFNLQTTRDVVTWNALMGAFGRLGDTKGVFALFDRMQDADVHPDDITFRCLLTACNHAGLVSDGTDHFEAMLSRYKVHPDARHYACLIDLLGRANRLDDAAGLIRSMPFNPNAVTWMTVLAACQRWNKVQLGKLAFESLTRLDDANSGAYVLMANTSCRRM